MEINRFNYDILTKQPNQIIKLDKYDTQNNTEKFEISGLLKHNTDLKTDEVVIKIRKKKEEESDEELHKERKELEENDKFFKNIKEIEELYRFIKDILDEKIKENKKHILLLEQYIKDKPNTQEKAYLEYKNSVKEFVKELIQYNPEVFKFANSNLRKDKEFVKENPKVILYAHEELLYDTEFIKANSYFKEILEEEHKLKNQYSTKKLKLFHLGKTKLDNDLTKEFIEYIPIINIEELQDILNTEDIIVIFIEEYDEEYDIDILNGLIQSITKPRKNIKIINTSSKPIKNNPYFYKILNILFKNIFSDIPIYYNYNYNKDGFIYRLLDLSEKQKKNRLLLTFWLILLINTPKCLENRFMQFNGTCWLNAVLNSLLLVEKIRNEIYKKFKEHCELSSLKYLCELNYDQFRDEEQFTKNEEVKQLLFSLLKNYFTGIKPLHSDEDFLLPLAALMKGVHVKNKNKLFDKYNIIEKDLTDEQKKKPIYHLCKASNANKLREKYCKSKNTEKIARLNNFCKYKEPNSICDNEYKEKSDEYLGFIFGNSYYPQLIILYLLELIFGKPFKFNEEIQLYDGTIILLLDNDKIISPEFKLKSAVIFVDNDNHVICGIMCNNDEIIYDSHNVWAYQKWTDLKTDKLKELTEYKKEFLKKIYKPKITDFRGKIDYRVYIKSK